MNRKTVLAYACACLAVYMLMPCDLTAADLNGKTLNAEGNQITSFVYGTPMNMICALSGVVCAVRAFTASTLTPLLGWGAGVMLVKFMPKFIETVF